MKAVIVLLVVLIGIWIWRNGQRAKQTRQAPHRPTDPRHTPAEPQEMLSCQVCGVHLPRDDAVIGAHGAYCSQAHRQQAEG